MLSRLRKKFRQSKIYKIMDSHIKTTFMIVVLLYLGVLFWICSEFVNTDIEQQIIMSMPLYLKIIPVIVFIGLFFVIFGLVLMFADDNLLLDYKNKDKIFVLSCGVIMLIIVFATLYVLITVFDCDAFNIGCKFNNVFDKMINMLYFSTMTLTTVGYGDIAPVSNLAKIIVSIEAITFTVIISFIIMNFKSKTNENKEKDTQQNEENNNE